MSKEIDQNTEDGDDPNVSQKKAKGKGLIMTIAIGSVAAGAAGAGVFMFAPFGSEDEQTASLEEADAAPAKKEKPEVSAKDLEKMTFIGAQVKAVDEKALFFLDPLIVSIRPMGESRHLRISVVLETALYDAPALGERLLNIRDIMNTHLRNVDQTQFQDPAAMMTLRTQMHRRIQAILPDAKIENVLITEFILT